MLPFGGKAPVKVEGNPVPVPSQMATAGHTELLGLEIREEQIKGGCVHKYTL